MRVGSLLGSLVALGAFVTADEYGYNHVAVRKDPEVIAANFRDVDVKLYSPAFLTPKIILPGFQNGTQGPTSHDDMDSWIEDIAKKNKYMSYKKAKFTSEEGRSFPYVHISAKSSNKNKVRVWIQGSVHGNEPAGDEATQALLGKFDKESRWAQDILKNVEIVVLPRYNPDGAFYFQRTLASNFDPNRDHIKLARDQTRDIKSFMNDFKPHVVIDMHEYGSSARFGSGGRYAHASDGLFSAAKNLNINKNIRELSEELFAPKIGEAMEAVGLRWEPYVTGSSSSSPDYVATFAEAGSDAKIGRNAMGLTQAVVFLIEMRGIGLADQHFQRRTASGLTMITSIVQTAADNAAEVFRTVEDGIDEFVASKDEIVITDYSESAIRPFGMIDVNNGSVVKAPVRFASTTPVIANLTRARPEAYLIPVAWSGLAERLKVAGLKVETLKKPWSGTVEALTVTSTSFANGYYEGVVLVDAKTETKQRELTLPAGSFLVNTRQKNAALAFIALEPENIDSYVSANIVPVSRGDEYPVFRVMS
ncbi:Carboxypeptidase 2 [Paramyrothecium foliicola]|nr:Carboxypeptidase 2 [Paramyrothecium foliicola]